MMKKIQFQQLKRLGQESSSNLISNILKLKLLQKMKKWQKNVRKI
jgi:hypothetical protein